MFVKNLKDMKHISYPKIQQFRNIVQAINREASYVGADDNGEPVYDPLQPKPTLEFTGTVKLHGTNASVCFNSIDGFWAQSRKNIITVDKDNAGFAFFAYNNKIEFCSLIDKIVNDHQIDTNNYTVSIYGEWAGKGIQKGVGISEIEKAFFIFGVKVSHISDNTVPSYWLESSELRFNEKRIYNIEDFQTYRVIVDFGEPQMSQNKFIEITEQVEKECPVALFFGIKESVGEGVVWSTEYNGNVHRFKVKGEKHSVSRVKKLASVDTEKLESIKSFVDYAVTENRFNQAIESIFGDGDLDITKMGDLLRWMVKDIASEEMDVMADNNLEPRDVNKYISHKTREMFFELQKTFS